MSHSSALSPWSLPSGVRAPAAVLVADWLATAWKSDIDRVFGATTTAPEFFRRFGFAEIDRAFAPASLQASPEFAALCPSTATCMVVSI